jgi:hypothetical protein
VTPLFVEKDIPAGAGTRGDAGHLAAVVEPEVFRGDSKGNCVIDHHAVGAIWVGGNSLEGQRFCLHIQGVAGKRKVVKVTSGKDFREGTSEEGHSCSERNSVARDLH